MQSCCLWVCSLYFPNAVWGSTSGVFLYRLWYTCFMARYQDYQANMTCRHAGLCKQLSNNRDLVIAETWGIGDKTLCLKLVANWFQVHTHSTASLQKNWKASSSISYTSEVTELTAWKCVLLILTTTNVLCCCYFLHNQLTLALATPLWQCQQKTSETRLMVLFPEQPRWASTRSPTVSTYWRRLGQCPWRRLGQCPWRKAPNSQTASHSGFLWGNQ